MNDKTEGGTNIRPTRKPTWKEKRIYFFKLLENVLLTGVPQIVTENSTRRKIFKTTVLFACLTGFSYHLISFIILYLSYPTSLEVLVKFQNTSTLPKPIVTVCDLNGIRRTAYCKDFSDSCESPDDVTAFCSNFDHFCEKENTTQEDLQFLEYAVSMFDVDYDRDTVEKYGIRAEDILNMYRNSTKRVIFANEFGKLRNCYSLDLMNFDTDSVMEFMHAVYKMHMLEGTSIGDLIVRFNPEELARPNTPIGAKVSIHSTDQLINPFVDGFLVKPGMRYIIQLKAIEENLLASPYSTNCTLYKSDNNAIPSEINYERCLIECRKERWLKECGCVSGEYAFQFDGKFCLTDNESNCIDEVDVDDCYIKCKVSCRSIFFEYEVDEVPLEYTEILTIVADNMESSKKKWSRKKTWFSPLNLFFKRPELLIYKYKPQFELIELFSYIGGYIGIWLGISLIAVCDFLEMLFTYSYHVIKGKIPMNREANLNHLLESKSDS